ncbi:MAG: DUF4390 domain-containing protein [Mailhella sp.]|nr:DUF4390 domain-containing protein [Mailhella sp.]
MKVFFGYFFFFCLPFALHAQDYDSFVLNYQSVQVLEDKIRFELVFEQPKKHKIANVLKNGAILKLVVDTELQQKKFLKNTVLSSHSLMYYLRYDPLTKQFTAMRDSNTFARNADAEFLLNLLIKNIVFEIPFHAEKRKQYVLKTKIDLIRSNEQSWFGVVQLLEPDKIIQPLEFEYDFLS